MTNITTKNHNNSNTVETDKILKTLEFLATGETNEEAFLELIIKDLKDYPDANINCIIENCIAQNQHQNIFKQKILFALRFNKMLKSLL